MQGQQARHHLADARHHDIASCEIDRDIELRIGPEQLPQLFKQALQDEVGHLADLPGVFRHGDKQIGAGQRAVRSSPAQQGFSADAVAAVEIEDRLIQHLQLATAYRAMQFGIQRLTLAHQQEYQETDESTERQTRRQ